MLGPHRALRPPRLQLFIKLNLSGQSNYTILYSHSLTSASDEFVRPACNHESKENRVATKRVNRNANREAPTALEANITRPDTILYYTTPYHTRGLCLILVVVVVVVVVGMI